MIRSVARAAWMVWMAGVLILPAYSQSLQLSVSPTNLVWTSNAWVTVTATNLTAGADVDLWLFADVDRDGALSAADVLMGEFPVQDGLTNGLGATVVPHDTDGRVNGAVVSRVSYHGVDSPYHTIGSYLWAAGTGAFPVVSRFDVTQPTSTVWVTGEVGLYGFDTTATGAIVMLNYYFPHQGFAPKVWTDTAGVYRIYLPENVSTANVMGVSCVKPGCFATPFRDDTMEYISSHPFTNDLRAGANVVTNRIKLVVPIPDVVYTISGTLYDDQGHPVAGGWVFFEPDGKDGFAMAVSDANGDFSMPSPGDFEGALSCSGPLLNLRGLAGAQNDPVVITNHLAEDLHCPVATILARAPVVDQQTRAPLTGVEIAFEGEGESSGYSLDNGNYEVCIVSNTAYGMGASPEDYLPLGYAQATYYTATSITNAGLYTNAPIDLSRGYVLSGRVYDRQTNALSEGIVEVFPYGFWNREAGAEVNRQGGFELLVVTGQYRVSASDFQGHLSMSYSNHFLWEWDVMGPAADPVAVSTNGASGIHFYLEPESYIRGTVRSGGVPISNAVVFAVVGWEQRASVETAGDGAYELGVLAGSNYIVQVEPPEHSFWMYQYYSNKYYDAEADAVTTTVAAAATNIDFDLPLGGRVQGMLYQADGATPITNQWGVVEIRRTNYTQTVNSQPISASGSYGVVVPAGIYHVLAYADDYLRQYYRGVYEYQWEQANVVTVQVGQVTPGIDFAMLTPSLIRGTVTSGGGPVTGLHLYAHYWPDTNSYWVTPIGFSHTDTNGAYLLDIPPGTNFIVTTDNSSSNFYLVKYWSNVAEMAQAIRLTVTGQAELVGINFNLELGLRIEGTVFNEHGGALSNLWVEAMYVTSNGSPVSAGSGATDASGRYGFPVSASTSYLVRVQRPWEIDAADWWYPETYFNRRFNAQTADTVWTNPGRVAMADIYLDPGYRVRGQVLRSDGFTPAPNGRVQSLDGSLTPYPEAMPDWTDWYDLVLPTNAVLYLQGYGLDLVPEYYSNTYRFAEALPFQKGVMTTTYVDFVLYSYTEDNDLDGLPDYQEDTRPDGWFIPSQDWASYTNVDTDGDLYYDNQEFRAGTSPQDAASFLQCVNVTRTGSGRVIAWAAATNVNYMVQRCSSLGDPSGWADWMPATGTGAVMTVTDNDPAAAHSAYRVKVAY